MSLLGNASGAWILEKAGPSQYRPILEYYSWIWKTREALMDIQPNDLEVFIGARRSVHSRASALSGMFPAYECAKGVKS